MKKSIIFIQLGLILAVVTLIVDSAVADLPGWALMLAAAVSALLLILGFLFKRREKRDKGA